MYCAKCGNQMPNDSRFCPQCGSCVNAEPAPQQPPVYPQAPVAPQPRYEYDQAGHNFNEPPVEQPVPEQPAFFQQAPDTTGSAKSAAGSLGTILMMGSIVFDLVSMVAIGSDAFIPTTIAAGVIFGIGFLLRMASI
jgi:hypothetical protein